MESFLFENPNYMNTAYAVKEAWPSVVNKVVEPYFRHLTDSIRNKVSGRKDIQVSIKYSFQEGDGYISLCLYSENWIQYENPNRYYDTNGRYCIVFSNDRKHKPNWWFVGVRHPIFGSNMNDDEKTQFNKIKKRLDQVIPENRSNSWFPGYKNVDHEKRDWEPILESLLEETKQKKGDFSDYYVKYFWDFADKAIRILDDTEKHP